MPSTGRPHRQEDIPRDCRKLISAPFVEAVFVKNNKEAAAVLASAATTNIEDVIPTIAAKGIDEQRCSEQSSDLFARHALLKTACLLLRDEVALTDVSPVGCEPAWGVVGDAFHAAACGERKKTADQQEGSRQGLLWHGGRNEGGNPVMISRMIGSEDLAADLKNTGLKVTLPRLRVLAIFEQSKTRHLSAEDVYKVLLSEAVDIGLATVYRVLLQFEQAGLLRRSNFESGKSVFELNQGSHHDHLVCLDCGRVEEFYDSKIEDRQHKIAEERGFTLQEHSLALYGQCQRGLGCPHRPGAATAGAPARSKASITSASVSHSPSKRG